LIVSVAFIELTPLLKKPLLAGGGPLHDDCVFGAFDFSSHDLKVIDADLPLLSALRT
jgi:hypothetical protein